MKVIINGHEVAVVRENEKEVREKGDVYCYMLACEGVESLNCNACHFGLVGSIRVEELRRNNEFID